MISYELALGLSLIGPILLTGTLDLTKIVETAVSLAWGRMADSFHAT
jgi:NADH:ubiquinone oxidoreductase subunit 1 (chain H)